MKQIIVFVVVFAVCGNFCLALDEEFVQKVMKKMQQIADECVKETGASDDDIGELLEKKIPNTKEGKCMISCFGTHLGVTDANGQYSEEGVKTALAPLKEADENLYNTMYRISKECSEEITKTDDKCETAANYLQCSLRKEKEAGLENGALSF